MSTELIACGARERLGVPPMLGRAEFLGASVATWISGFFAHHPPLPVLHGPRVLAPQTLLVRLGSGTGHTFPIWVSQEGLVRGHRNNTHGKIEAGDFPKSSSARYFWVCGRIDVSQPCSEWLQNCAVRSHGFSHVLRRELSYPEQLE